MDEKATELGVVSYDECEMALTARARHTIASAKSRSPVTFFGKESIRNLAAELTSKRKKSRPEVTAFGLTLALRRVVRTVVNFTNGSELAIGRTNGNRNPTVHFPARASC